GVAGTTARGSPCRYLLFTVRSSVTGSSFPPTRRPTVSIESNPLSRRQFVGRAAAAGVAVRLAGSVEALYTAQPALGTSGPKIGYGPLIEDPDGMLDLPRGFSYKILSREGTVRPDGLQTP